MTDQNTKPENSAIVATTSLKGSTIEGQIRELYARTVYTHKTQEKCADAALATFSKLKRWQVILSAVTTGSVLSSLTPWLTPPAPTVVAAACSATLLALNMYLKEYNLGEVAQKHKQAANEIWGIREQYLSLLTDISDGVLTSEEARRRRDDLVEELGDVYHGAPSTTSKAYQAAQKALKEAEDMTFQPGEIDEFLIPALKRDKEDVE